MLGAPAVGLLVLARDEEADLPRCLASVLSDVAEMVLVDMESADATREIARGFGSRVVEVPYNRHFDLARQAGLNVLTTEWVLQLDADEWAPELLQRVADGDWYRRGDALRCPKLNYLGQRPYTRQGWWPNKQVRLFKRDNARYTSVFHRPLEVRGRIVDLPSHPGYAIHHMGTTNAAEMICDATRYLPASAHPMNHRAVLRTLGGPLARFLLSRAWRDGSDGVSIFAAHVLNEVGRHTSADGR